MSESKADHLVGFLLGAFVFSLIGYAGIRSLISGLRNSAKKKYPRLYNYFGILTGIILIAWVLFLFFVLGYFWFKNG
jgi:amino acid permease